MMKFRKFEAVNKNEDASDAVTLVRRAGSVLGAGALAILAVGVVGVYAFIGGSSIPKADNVKGTAAVKTVSAADTSSAEETQISVSQAAETWKKAGIEEYDLVIETVKATETAKNKTSAKSAKTAEKTAKTTEKTSAKTEAVTTAATTAVTEQVTTEAEKQEAPAAEEVKPCAAVTMYTNDKVNMRKGPTLDDDIITILSENTEITVTGYTSDWYRIKADGKTGYCMKRYADESKPETPAADVISYTDDEFDMLCYVLQGEVGDCSEESKIAVANVIINRVKSSAFPDSISGVLTQADQFTAVYNYYNGYNTPSENTIECARRALGGEDNSNGAIYYYAPQYCSGSTAAWFETLTFCLEVDGQRYFK